MSGETTESLIIQDATNSHDYSMASFKEYIGKCKHREAHCYNSVFTCVNCSVYINQLIKGIKEESYDAYGNIPIEEHWCELISDESTLWQPLAKSQSNIADLRKSMIEWIFHLGDKLKQRSLTLQLAIVYIDKLFLLGKYNEMQKDKHLWGLTALYIASKYDEIDENIPFIRDFRKASSRGNYTWDQVTKCENLFVKLMDWNLMIISPLNYTYALLTFGVIFSDDQCKFKASHFQSKIAKGDCENNNLNDKNQEIILHKLKSVRKYCEFFTDMALQSFDCQQYKYSVQSLGAVVAARRTCGIKPIWNESFNSMTGYSFDDIEECYEKLFSKYEKFFCK